MNVAEVEVRWGVGAPAEHDSDVLALESCISREAGIPERCVRLALPMVTLTVLGAPLPPLTPHEAAMPPVVPLRRAVFPTTAIDPVDARSEKYPSAP